MMILCELMERWSKLETSSVVQSNQVHDHYSVKYGKILVLISASEEDNDDESWSFLQYVIQQAIVEHEFFVDLTYSPSSKFWLADVWSANTKVCSGVDGRAAIALLEAYLKHLESITPEESEA